MRLLAWRVLLWVMHAVGTPGSLLGSRAVSRWERRELQMLQGPDKAMSGGVVLQNDPRQGRVGGALAQHLMWLSGSASL